MGVPQIKTIETHGFGDLPFEESPVISIYCLVKVYPNNQASTDHEAMLYHT